MAMPDFLCIGAQKAGTTWLDRMFSSHTNIWTPPVKEIQYFNELYMPNSFEWTTKHRKFHGEKAKKWELQCKYVNPEIVELAEHIADGEISKEWYEKIFDHAPKNTIKGEMTPEYSLLSLSNVEYIANQYPNLKIIFVMRDPLERALSGIRMLMLREGFYENAKQVDIDNFVIKCAKYWDIIERGNYKHITETWVSVFGSDSVMLLLSSDLRDRPELSLQYLSDFLEVDKMGFKGPLHKKVHEGRHYNISNHAIDVVRQFQKNNCEYFTSFKNQWALSG